LDVIKPNVARVCNSLVGGSQNFAADRAQAEELTRIYPRLPDRPPSPGRPDVHRNGDKGV
jgi:hypothetical protein